MHRIWNPTIEGIESTETRAKASAHPARLQGRLARALARGALSPGRLTRLIREIARSLQDEIPENELGGCSRREELIAWAGERAQQDELCWELGRREEGDYPHWVRNVLKDYLLPGWREKQETGETSRGHLERAIASGCVERERVREILERSGPGTGTILDEFRGGDASTWLERLDKGRMIPEKRWVVTPGGGTCEIPSCFHINSVRGDDRGEGTFASPFKTFWPIRWWFALIELLGLEGWSFTDYRVRLCLHEASLWRMRYDRINLPSLPPRFMDSLLAPWHPFVSQALDVAIMYLEGTLDHHPEFYQRYGDPAAGIWYAHNFYQPCFLKVPTFLAGLEVISLGLQGGTPPTIVGTCSYNEANEGTSSTDNPLLSTTMGTFWNSGEFGDPIGFTFHDSNDVLLQGFRMDGFHIGLKFCGLCHETTVTACSFENMQKNGMIINMIESRDYLCWNITQTARHQGRVVVAYAPLLFSHCSEQYDIGDCYFFHIGYNTAGASISIGTCVSNLELHHSTFVACVDGLMADQSGSGLHIHHNAFVLLKDGNEPGGDGNGVDIKAVRPRTAETYLDLFEDPVPFHRWTWVHDNYILGCSGGGGLIMHKGTGWVHAFNNFIVDNIIGIGLSPHVESFVPVGNEPSTSNTVSNPYGITFPVTWRSPIDRYYETSGGRTLYKMQHLYLYRNVIAANWNHGIEVLEGVTENPADALPIAYGLSIEDLVIAHNTIDSNGGSWLGRDPPGSDTYNLQPGGIGVVLARYAGENGLATFYDFDLKDCFAWVAIYNNIISNSFYFQVDIRDECLSTSIWRNLRNFHRERNLIARYRWDQLDGITQISHYGIDFNAYFYKEDLNTPGLYFYTAAHYEGGVPAGTTIIPVGNDVRISMYPLGRRPLGDNSVRGTREHLYLVRGERIHDELAVEVNSQDLFVDGLSYWDLFERSPLMARVQDYTYSTDIRGSYPGLDLAWLYLSYCDGGLNWWRTLESSMVKNTGASSQLDFPDQTCHAETEEPVINGPDINGDAIKRQPDRGAYEIPISL